MTFLKLRVPLIMMMAMIPALALAQDAAVPAEELPRWANVVLLALGAIAGAFGAPVALAASGSFVGLFALFGEGLHKGIRGLGHAGTAEPAEAHDRASSEPS